MGSADGTEPCGWTAPLRGPWAGMGEGLRCTLVRPPRWQGGGGQVQLWGSVSYIWLLLVFNDAVFEVESTPVKRTSQ